MNQAESAEKTRRAVDKYTARANLYTCPISRCLIVNAVLVNGQRYERDDLVRFIEFRTSSRLPCTCPATRATLQTGDLVPDPQFAQIVEGFVNEVTAKAAKDTSREQWADLLDDCTRWTQARAGTGAAPTQPYSYSEPEPLVTGTRSIYSPTSPTYNPAARDDADMPEDDYTPTTPVYTGAQRDSAIVLEDSDDEQASGANEPRESSGAAEASGAADFALIGCIVSDTREPGSRLAVISKDGAAITLFSLSSSTIVYAQEVHIQPAPVLIDDTVKIITGPLAHQTGKLRGITRAGQGVVMLTDSSQINLVPLASCAPLLRSN